MIGVGCLPRLRVGLTTVFSGLLMSIKLGLGVGLPGGSRGGSAPDTVILLWTGNNDPQLAAWQANFLTGDSGTLVRSGNNIYLVNGDGSKVYQIDVSAASPPIDGTLHVEALTATNSYFLGEFVLNFHGQLLRGVTGLDQFDGNNAGGNGTDMDFGGNPLTLSAVNQMLFDLNSSSGAGPDWGSDSTIDVTTVPGTNAPTIGPPDGLDAMNTLIADGWTVTADA